MVKTHTELMRFTVEGGRLLSGTQRFDDLLDSGWKPLHIHREAGKYDILLSREEEVERVRVA